jgi:exopolyphosphatase/guanosine-5'-triphosphate,3'-diphosphate pyrophosphatase
MTRVAAVDCGTNSVRLLVTDLVTDAAGRSRLADVVRRLEINRLGQGVDRTGRLSEEALARTRAFLADYAGIVAELDVAAIRVVATSATRDAANSDDFVSLVDGLLGVTPEVISGREEATLSFLGAMRSLDPPPPGPVLVCDIGGGSTELIRGEADEGGALDVTAAYSMDIGSVRLTERRLHNDPPTADQVERARHDIAAALDHAAAHVPLSGHRTFVGLAGTVTTLAALVLRLPRYEELDTHGEEVSREDLEKVAARLLGMTHDQRSAEPVIHPGRVDVIAAGGLILTEILRRTGSPEVLVSEHDILDGIAWGVADSLG